jgi:LCP family protein required for cell wall assembly
VAVVLVLAAAGYFYLDSKVHRVDVLTDYSGRPAAGAGTNWLITGSDSRQGLTHKQMRQLATGFDVHGHRSDTVLLLHIPASGGPAVLVSLPRDSYVPIPGYGMNKLNAAYAFGGSRLLAKTVQNATGLRIDHYMSIGFGGLADVVNNVGGVRVCVKTAIPADSFSGFKGLAAGCHNLNGTQAIAFVRDRHSFATSDLQRIEDQRAFLQALLSKATSPGVYLNPFTALPFGSSAASSVAVDKGTSLYDLLQVAFALRGPETGTVPIANANFPTSAGDAVLWNRTQALQLFNALQAGKPVPAGLLTGTKVG